MALYNASLALGLRPLDRLQVYDAEVRRELRNDIQRGSGMAPPPFWYFMFVTPEGKLAASSPSGYVNYLDPTDVLDIIPSKDGPIMIKAVTDRALLAWLARTNAERQQARPDTHDAYLVGARRGRLGELDFNVRFIDPDLNHPREGTQRFAPLSDADRRRVQPLVSRTRMPVRADRGGNWSADHGLAAAESKARHKMRSFLDSALAGDTTRARAIAACDVRKAA